MSLTRFYCPQKYAPGNALVNWSGRPLEDLVTYAETYRSAACRLVQAQQSLNLNAPDQQALPILYLYRHSLELFLKSIVYHAATLSISETELPIALPRLWREHSLLKLQKMARPVLDIARWPSVDTEELATRLATTSAAIDSVDSGSYAFRYPVTTTGTSSLPPAFLVNMFHFSDEMESVLEQCRLLCGDLRQQAGTASTQMKLALHSLTSPVAT
ncbi:MAG: hypothetical protein A2W72_02450 [Burkholderiales bacterium RIFCSPLOWO2_12_67_14]|nr:MAG: hypothetical protein A3I64_20250 [Burkholderiales bacterium RIFCSPLOWO2_02_FULL_67_64]OGB35848.1 MAG: hypothetical protein A3E51_06315 [Burkholderiales bacterium RIFCSPHIGHO2_12_FULL_67_38]OGB38524.1 MAG: hypothetical protein A2W72_02450 [Burkholderiales bacterium RIFCSPLOWO2_12_67_14]OGB76144.1 MAG: hypothetical protein A3G82_19735 [Burkholderiales bacterium RIFCSPLOWO2_12_FULL_67_210]